MIHLLVVIGFLSIVVSAQSPNVPSLINYQGRLSNADGSALATADYTLSFSIYDSADNGTKVWGPQTFDGTTGAGHGGRIPVVQGYFNAMLGPMDVSSVAIATAFSAPDRYIEVRIGTNEPIRPRQQILSAPFALHAQKADQAEHAENASNADSLGGVPSAELGFSRVPVGAIVSFWGDPVSLPSNWRICDGSAVTDPNSAFNGLNVPDLRGMFVRGAENGPDLAQTGGQDFVSGHSHYHYHTHTAFVNVGSSFFGTYFNNLALSGGGSKFVVGGDNLAALSHSHSATATVLGPSDSYTDEAGDHDNRPRYFALHYIVRIK